MSGRAQRRAKKRKAKKAEIKLAQLKRFAEQLDGREDVLDPKAYAGTARKLLDAYADALPVDFDENEARQLYLGTRAIATDLHVAAGRANYLAAGLDVLATADCESDPDSLHTWRFQPSNDEDGNPTGKFVCTSCGAGA